MQNHQRSGSRTRFGAALVVEDDPGMATALADLLTEAGYHPVSVRSVAEAKARLDDHLPDLVLLDLSLEDSFGADLLEAVSDDEAAPPIVVVSGFKLAPLVAQRYGVELVEKPFEDETLFAAIRRAMERASRPKISEG